MNIQHYKLNLDLLKNTSTPVLYSHQLDKKSRFIDVTLTANDAEVTLDSTMTAVLNATTNNVIVASAQNCTISDNVIVVELTDKVLALPGVTKCEVVLSDSSGAVITAQHFIVKITEKAINDKSKFEPTGSNLATEAAVAKAKAEAIEYFETELTDLDETVTMKINLKADKADTLAGYGITDAYDKTYLDKALRDKLNKMPFDTVPKENSPNYITSGTLYNSVNSLNQTIEKNKTAVDTSLANKADLIATYNIFDFDAWAKELQELTVPIIRGTLDKVNYNEKSITFTNAGDTRDVIFTNGWDSSAPQSMRIAVKPSTKYIVSWLPSSTNSTVMVLLNGLNTSATRFTFKSKAGLFTTAEDTTYITIRFDYSGTGTFKVSNIMISESEAIYLPDEVAEGVLDVANEVSAFEKTTETALATKYDATNNEIGSGELSPTQTIYEGSEGNFVYAKNGDAVTVSVNITSMLADKNYLQMSGLPFPSKTESKLASIAVYSTANKLRNVRIVGSWIYISSPSDKFVEDEKMNFVVTYIIRR